ncbi:hypothetical protein [Leptospira sp. GIMC2001]|uniref:hypothetical protein n=1 Tax=Leptospira sp. GIMC2001 TaxID=1513297 RepID=UPI00234A9FA7|nr:hypothetical protein [Leptospira sp. GIMC2001]WCL49269.1 hypothetical protein O4O04_18545 [Leptospira sp. GIMC2001]
MKIAVIAVIFFYNISIFADSQDNKPKKNQVYKIPDVEGFPLSDIKEPNKQEKDIVAEEPTEEIEKFYISNVRALPISEGFANRPKELEKEKLLIAGRIQFRGMSGQRESSFNNGSSDYNAVDWNFRRLRFGFIYEGNKWWGMLAQIAMEKQSVGPYISSKTNPITGAVEQVEINKSQGSIYQANLWFHIPVMESMLFLGQIRLPFLREWSSAANLLTPERSYANSTLPQFDLGAQYVFHPLSLFSDKYKNHLLVRGSITNGTGASSESVGYKSGLTETRGGSRPLLISPAYHWRVTYDPFGGFIRDGYDVGWHEGEEIFQSNQRLSIGIGGMHMNELKVMSSYEPFTRGVSNQTFLTNQSSESGGLVRQDLPDYNVDNTITTPSRKQFDLQALTYDFTYTVNGYYASGAYTRFRGQASNDTETYNYTLGYVIPIKSMYLMPTYRYEVIEGDFNRNGRRDNTDILRSHWLGVNLFAERHLMKFQFFYQIENDRYGYDPISNQSRDMDNNKFYFQVQMIFWSGAVKMED